MAAIRYFLKLDGIEGGSIADKHPGEVDVDSFSWGESSGSSPASGGAGTGKVNKEDFRCAMKASKASPKLMVVCATGKGLKSAVLSCESAGPTAQTPLKITMSDVTVSSYQTGGGATVDAFPVDSIALDFAKIEIEFTPQKPDGSAGTPVKAGFDFKTNKSF